MRVKARMGMSLDGMVATSDGVPAIALAAGFVPGSSHGYPEFIAGCDAVVMGRATFLPALAAPSWPWGAMQTFVLTSSPLPPETPRDVVAVDDVAALVGRLRSRGSEGDVHLVGGPSTVRAFHEAGALDILAVVLLPLVLGEGQGLWPPAAPPPKVRFVGASRAFPDGSLELRCALS